MRSIGLACDLHESTFGLRSVKISFLKRSVGKLKVLIVTTGGLLFDGVMRVNDELVVFGFLFEERGPYLYCLLKRKVENLV